MAMFHLAKYIYVWISIEFYFLFFAGVWTPFHPQDQAQTHPG